MTYLTGIALSGLKAASLRVQASASNIANLRSSGATPGGGGQAAYQPLEIHETACASGGVEAALAASSRDALLVYDPSAPFANAQGYVAMPDIDLVDEMLQLAAARYSFAANLEVLRTADEMQDDVRGLIT